MVISYGLSYVLLCWIDLSAFVAHFLKEFRIPSTLMEEIFAGRNFVKNVVLDFLSHFYLWLPFIALSFLLFMPVSAKIKISAKNFALRSQQRKFLPLKYAR